MDKVKLSDKVIILGTAESWKKAPLTDSTWEIWGMNDLWYSWGKYATRWFEIHQLSILFMDGWDNYSWLEKCSIPVYMAKHYSNIPNSIEYPLGTVSKGYLKEFSSTFCYEMALAIHEGFKTIGIYGVDFSQGTLRERFIEWRGFLYWLGVAMGKGINIQFPKGGKEKLFNQYLYGMDYWNEVKDVRSQIKEPIRNILDWNIDGVNGMLKRKMNRLQAKKQ